MLGMVSPPKAHFEPLPLLFFFSNYNAIFLFYLGFQHLDFFIIHAEVIELKNAAQSHDFSRE
ncbi:hypothetical protein ACTNDZ_13665 [Selenomonas montiformis]|uniref:hypothetical protein n=1 Tax=Selenomonas montiformis TaxID=2652285 RepID=UPI003F8B9784